MCSCTRRASTSNSPLSRRRVGISGGATPQRSRLYLGCCSVGKRNQVHNAPRCGKVAAAMTLNHRTSSQNPMPSFRGARAPSLGSNFRVGLLVTIHIIPVAATDDRFGQTEWIQPAQVRRTRVIGGLSDVRSRDMGSCPVRSKIFDHSKPRFL
jgi:hypothetical protein